MRSNSKNFYKFITIALTLSGTISGCASVAQAPTVSSSAANKSTLALIGSYRVERFELKNGLKLRVIEDHSSPTFAYQTWFKVGSRDEEPGRTGLAHLFEHMMFKETKNLKDGEFDKLLETAGAEGENAFTTQDNTTYVQELPKERLDLITRLEAERMVNLVVNEQAFSTEREVVHNERRMRNENSPDGLMYQELMATAFVKHPYHWPVIGYEEDLNRLTAEDALKFYRAHYSPNHATIVVAGDVNAQEVLALVEKYYGAITAQPSQRKTFEPDAPPSSPRRKTLRLNIQVEKLLMGYPIPEVIHPDMAALDLIQSVLSGGKSSRLNRVLVETGIASAAYAYSRDAKDPSLYIFGAQMQKNKKASMAESLIVKELERLTRELVPEAELTRAKNILNFEFYTSFESNSERAQFVGRSEVLADSVEHGLDRQKKIQMVTPEEVLKVAQKYFSPKNRTVISGLKKEAL